MNYFAYGSNMDQNQMKERCPNSILIGKAVLKNYRLDFFEYSPRWQGGCADIVPDKNSEVWGLLYDVLESDINELDKFEGSPSFYRRTTMQVEITDVGVGAEVYILVNKKPFTAPTIKYLNIIKATSKDFDFPADYQKYLDSIEIKKTSDF